MSAAREYLVIFGAEGERGRLFVTRKEANEFIDEKVRDGDGNMSMILSRLGGTVLRIVASVPFPPACPHCLQKLSDDEVAHLTKRAAERAAVLQQKGRSEP